MNTFIPILVATIIQFIVGALWYSALFGKLWGNIHGFDKLGKEVQAKMMAQMGPLYGVQFIMTVITSYVLYQLIKVTPIGMPYMTAAMIWLGFILPTQVSSVIFGGTEARWIVTKILVMSGAALACIMSATFVFSFF